MRKQLLDAIYNGKPFRAVLRDLGPTSNQVWELTPRAPTVDAGARVTIMITLGLSAG
jgi:hypothetical protein